MEAHILDSIELHRLRWENTSNPIYVWLALSACFQIGALRDEAQTGARPTVPGSVAYPFPAWCMLYLGMAAVRINFLTDGIDYRQAREPVGEGSSQKNSILEEADPTIRPIMKSAEAARLTLAALGIKRTGGNAYDDFWTLRGKEWDEFSEESLRFSGKSARETMDILLEESRLYDDKPITDERSMKRRISQARRLATDRQGKT